MSRRWDLPDQAAFLEKLQELRDQGVEPHRIDVATPYHVHQADRLLAIPPSPLRWFTLVGTLAGLVLGFALPIVTVLDWPLITGGKPLISLPAFVVIAFELAILLGAIASFIGYMILSRFPSPRGILEPMDHQNRFVVLLREDES